MKELDGKRILVTFLMRLGDLALITPFIHALRKAAPNAHIAFLADEKLKDVILHNPNLDEVITIDKMGRDNSMLALMACARRLSAMHFDVLINLHPNERCSFICALTKVGYRTGTSHGLFKGFWDKWLPLDRSISIADMYLKVLQELGVEQPEHNGLEIFTSEKDQEGAADFWRANGVFATDKLIGFNIGSSLSAKRWPPERFAQVADYFALKGYKPVFFGGTMDEEFVDKAVGTMQATPIVATGELALGELAIAMTRCSLIITNDSGPMYVALSQKLPVVGLYGPSVPQSFEACRNLEVAVKAKSIMEITTKQVIAAAEALLATCDK